jgi:hypothetical protein
MMPGDLVPIFGMITGVIISAAFFWGLVKVAQSPVGEALARRIQGRHGGPDPELLAELSQLRDQVEALQNQLYEAQERIDFTERLLTQGREVREGR